jgi:hypothetical protein
MESDWGQSQNDWMIYSNHSEDKEQRTQKEWHHLQPAKVNVQKKPFASLLFHVIIYPLAVLYWFIDSIIDG